MKIIAILSAIALAAAAFLAFKNKEKYGAELELRQGEEKRLAKNTATFEDLSKQFTDTETERKSVQEATVVLREQEAKQLKANTTVQKDVDAKKSESEANATKIAAIEEKLKETGEIKELVVTIKETTKEIERLTTEIASNDAQLADLLSEKARTEGVIADYRKIDKNYSDKVSYFSSTRISSIFPAYGFVTLPIGNSGGVIAGSPLNVVRDGSIVAKLRVSSVESGRAAAEIVPDSLVPDTVLMVGDQVVPSSDAAK